MVWERLGLKSDFVDSTDLDAIEKAIPPETRCSSSRPRPIPPWKSRISAGVGRASRRSHGLISVVDNTFATPCLQQPLAFRPHDRRAQPDQVPERAQRYAWRHGRHERPGDSGAPAIHPEGGGRHPEPVRCLALPPRNEDAGRTHEAALRERHDGGRVACRPSRRCNESIIQGCQSIPSTPLPASRCADLAG